MYSLPVSGSQLTHAKRKSHHNLDEVGLCFPWLKWIKYHHFVGATLKNNLNVLIACFFARHKALASWVSMKKAHQGGSEYPLPDRIPLTFGLDPVVFIPIIPL